MTVHACIQLKKETRNKRDIGMVSKEKRQDRDGDESLQIMALLSVQCLQVDDVIPILSPC